MLYPKNQQGSLDPALFQNPTSEYRATPFWAWNCKLDPEMLTRQIEILKKMGMGGFHMHSRSGMATKYLSDEFMDNVRACVDKARKEDMLAWLYDEDRWPSGAAGGLVTKDEAYRARYLLFTPTPYGQGKVHHVLDSRADGGRNENGRLLARYAVTLKEDGCLGEYARLEDGQEPPAGAWIWYAYLESMPPSPWFNNQSYLDTLSPAAVQKFIETTHERYLEVVGGEFGGVVPAIFTDEPQFTRKSTLGFAKSQSDASLPFTEDFEESYRAAYGAEVLDTLPELFWELPQGGVSLARYRYHDHVAERFSSAFADQVGAWCRNHGIMLTGHMMEEPTLESQTAALGEAMRSLRGFDLPGIDMLCNQFEFTTAKQAQSAARQHGSAGVLSELYGVTNWDFDFRGHKLQGDWQAALGITVRVPHLSWVSMAGEAKRDYPASINYQSPWHLEYPLVENHFARLNTALTRGKPVVRLGVIHPVESYWLRWGPSEQTHDEREQMDESFQNLCAWLLSGLIDFDYISESLLPGQCEKGGAPLPVGEMRYEAVLVPDMLTIRQSTLTRLEAFVQAGGKLIFAGRIPECVDAVPSGRARALAEKASVVPLNRLSVLQSVNHLRDVAVKGPSGEMARHLLYQMRQDGDVRWLFLANGRPDPNPDVPRGYGAQIRIAGLWTPTLYNTLTGQIQEIAHSHEGESTVLMRTLYAHDSLLLRLAPAEKAQSRALSLPASALPKGDMRMRGPVNVELSEPNVLLIDSARFKLDEGAWREREEILRIDKLCRKEAGLAARDDQLPQPWVVPEDVEYRHFVTLETDIHSEIAIKGACLALERADLARITLNGAPVEIAIDGYFTDESILCVPLPDLAAGVTTLQVTLPLGQRLGLEWMYLLGDFGVTLRGDEATLTPPVRELSFGDWTHQGLPFYAGNVTYKIPFHARSGVRVCVPQFRNPLIAVSVDNARVGEIAFAPYEAYAQVSSGPHLLSLTAYGNRANAFGAVHNCDPGTTWHGPSSWRTEGLRFCDEYRLRPTGILTAPHIWTE